MAYTTIDNPELNFQVKTYTGNGSTNAITLDGDENMQPDMVWLKSRSYTDNHVIHDSVRSSTKRVFPNLDQAEGTESTSVTSFDSNGFTLGADGIANGSSGKTYVAWNWLAGGSASSDSNGSITSSVSANTTAGFSIVSWTGSGANATVGHGLGAVPKMIIVKNRADAINWQVYHQEIGNDHSIFLDLTNGKDGGSFYWNDTTPTSSVFSVGTYNGSNGSSDNMIAYCFAEKQGYSKIGKYVANGNSDNAFVYTGFRPTFLLTKLSSTSGGGWEIVDSKRDGYNGENNRLYPNDSASEGTGNDYDLLSNGFKVRQSGGSQQSGRTNIYIAFAESPFVNSNGVPNNAR